jgi:hypothetical protein
MRVTIRCSCQWSECYCDMRIDSTLLCALSLWHCSFRNCQTNSDKPTQTKHFHRFFFWYFPHRVSLLMSYNVPTMTTLIYVFYSPLESHRSTSFGVFSVHHLQEHLTVFTSVVFPVHFQHYICLCSSEWFKRCKTCTSLSHTHTQDTHYKT